MSSGLGLLPADWSDWWWSAAGNALGGLLAVLAVGLLLRLSVALAAFSTRELLEGVMEVGIGTVNSIVLLLGLQHAGLLAQPPPTLGTTLGVFALALAMVPFSALVIVALAGLVRFLGVLLRSPQRPDPPDQGDPEKRSPST